MQRFACRAGIFPALSLAFAGLAASAQIAYDGFALTFPHYNRGTGLSELGSDHQP